jgi:hypothetical protein
MQKKKKIITSVQPDEDHKNKVPSHAGTEHLLYSQKTAVFYIGKCERADLSCTALAAM